MGLLSQQGRELVRGFPVSRSPVSSVLVSRLFMPLHASMQTTWLKSIAPTHNEKVELYQVWWCLPIIPTLKKQRREDCYLRPTWGIYLRPREMAQWVQIPAPMYKASDLSILASTDNLRRGKLACWTREASELWVQ